MCVCVCFVCVGVCVFVCVVFNLSFVKVCVCLSCFFLMCARVFVWMCVFVCVWVCVFECGCVCFMFECGCACMSVCVCVCGRVWINIYSVLVSMEEFETFFSYNKVTLNTFILSTLHQWEIGIQVSSQTIQVKECFSWRWMDFF